MYGVKSGINSLPQLSERFKKPPMTLKRYIYKYL
nr:MAG TPA: helix-turn-helix domain protein [Caudoviricetes sp.]